MAHVHPVPKNSPENSTKLIVITQPPKRFANQQYGKRHGFDVVVKTTLPKNVMAEATLKVELVYADDFSAVPEYFMKKGTKKRRPHKMLQVIDHPRPFNTDNGETLLRVRINDVSRNHRGRKFCLKLSVITQGATASYTYTTEIQVISKHPNRAKRARSSSPDACSCIPVTQSPEQQTGTENSHTCTTGAAWEVHAWKLRAFELIKSLESKIIGYGPGNTPIHQCPICKVVDSSGSGFLQHAKGCKLHRLLEDYDDEVSKCNIAHIFADETEHTAFMDDLATDKFFDFSF